MKFRAYPRYKPSGVEWLGDVPEHWEVDRLKRSSLRVTDGGHISPDLSSSDFPFVSTVDISGGKIDFDGCLRTSDECYRYLVHTGCRPHQDDLLFSKDGTVGRTAVVDVDREFVVASSLVIVSPKSTKLNTKFLDYWLNNSLLQQDILLQMSGAALRRISVEKVSRLPVWVPPSAEQRAIAAFLDRETGRVDRLVAKKRELIERLKEKRIALISRTVTRGLPAKAAAKSGLSQNLPLKPSSLDWLGDIPEHWAVVPFTKYVAEKSDYRGKTPDKQPDGVFLVTARNVRMGFIDYESSKEFIAEEDYDEVMRRGLPKKGDILFTTEAPLGNVALVDREDIALAQRIIRFRMSPAHYHSAFVLFAMMSDHFQVQLKSLSTGSTAEGLKASKLPILRLIAPPLPEQAAIAAYLDEETAKLDALVGKVEAAIERLQEYRTALITAAVTGKIDVRSTHR